MQTQKIITGWNTPAGAYFTCSAGHISEDTVMNYVMSQKRSGREPGVAFYEEA